MSAPVKALASPLVVLAGSDERDRAHPAGIDGVHPLPCGAQVHGRVQAADVAAGHFAAGLDGPGIPALVHASGPGTHSWTHRGRELEAPLPMLLEVLGKAPDG
jgi:hypothetical protein